MNPNASQIFLESENEAFLRDLGTALKVPVSTLQELFKYVNPENGLVLTDQHSAARIWTHAGLNVDQLIHTLSVLRHIRDTGAEKELSVDQILSEVESVCERHNISGLAERKGVLTEYLRPSPAYSKRQKAKPWAEGVFRNIVGFDASVELRAAFEEFESEELIGFVPLAVLRIAYRYDSDSDTQTRRVAFQMTEANLKKFLTTLERAQKRLSAIKTQLRDPDAVIDSTSEGDAR